MSRKVVNIDGTPYVPKPEIGTPNESLIRICEELLHKARSGELQCLVGTGFIASGMRLSVWGGVHTDVYQMLGALEWLTSEYRHRITSVSDDGPPERAA